LLISGALSSSTESADPIEVLHVRIVTGAGGGPEKTILNSARHFAGTRYRETACWIHAPGDPGILLLESKAKERDCPFLAVPDPHPFDVRTLLRMADLCRERRIRIWHGHDYKSNLFGVLLARLLGLSLVTTVHGWVHHTARTPFYFAVDRFALRRHAQVVAVSSDLYAACLDLGVPEDKLTLVENAIDTSEFRRRTPSSAPARSRLVVGAVGRLAEEKGFHVLVEAVERAVDLGADLELRIAGEGEEESRLRSRIASSRHAERLDRPEVLDRGELVRPAREDRLVDGSEAVEGEGPLGLLRFEERDEIGRASCRERV